MITNQSIRNQNEIIIINDHVLSNVKSITLNISLTSLKDGSPKHI